MSWEAHVANMAYGVVWFGVCIVARRGASCAVGGWCDVLWCGAGAMWYGAALGSAMRFRLAAWRREGFWVNLVSSIWKHLYSMMWLASLVSDWRPLPPTPTRSALPRGVRRMRQMRLI